MKCSLTVCMEVLMGRRPRHSQSDAVLQKNGGRQSGYIEEDSVEGLTQDLQCLEKERCQKVILNMYVDVLYSCIFRIVWLLTMYTSV